MKMNKTKMASDATEDTFLTDRLEDWNKAIEAAERLQAAAHKELMKALNDLKFNEKDFAKARKKQEEVRR
jgi:hypothetical protein